ncbi:hypothetical protein BGZ89_011576 [Linnemannia elongata]|nr:hypothetical protein BGZ89_011576 [Linnemannia elongata]
MQLVKTSPSTKALDLPEVRVRVASFLLRKDCLPCMRVSRAWFQDFAPAVWRTLDFANDATAFAKVTPEVLDKYGGFVSQTLNISTFEHVQALQHVKVNSITSMKIQLLEDWLWRALLSDLLRRSHGSITSLTFGCHRPNPDTFEEQRRHAFYYMHVNDIFAPFPSSTDPRSNASLGTRLKSLSLTHICLTREGFSSLLQYSPLLDELTLVRVMLICHKPGIPLYTGSALRYLTATFTQTVAFKSSNTEAMSALLLKNFKALESCTLPAKTLAMSTTLGLVSHLESLTTIRITGEIQDATSTQLLSVIMKLCRNLQVLSFESLVCDVEAVESYPWGCKELEELRVRFKGLDTPQDIDGCIKKLCSSRRSSGIIVTRPMDTDTISSRVAQYLLQFKQLRTVWLGGRDYYLPRSPT